MADHEHRRVALTRFELGQVALRDARLAREAAARHPAPGAQFPDALTERPQEGLAVVVLHYHS